MMHLLDGLPRNRSIGLILNGRNDHPLKIGRIISVDEQFIEMRLLSIYGRPSKETTKVATSEVIAVLYDEPYLDDLDYLSEQMPPAGNLRYTYIEGIPAEWTQMRRSTAPRSAPIFSIYIGDEPEFVSIDTICEKSHVITFKRYGDQGVYLGMYSVLIQSINKVRYGGDAEYAVDLLRNRKLSQ